MQSLFPQVYIKSEVYGNRYKIHSELLVIKT
jgi:hypothetical protein